MAGPVLLVEVPIADTTRAETAALVQACSEGLGSGRCELSSSTEAGDGIAIVSLRGRDGLGALIEVGSRRTQSRAWRSQEIDFQPQDARIERFRTLGLAIATLYNEARLDVVGGAREGGAKATAATGRRDEKTPQVAEKARSSPETPSREEASPLVASRSARGSATPTRGWLSAGTLAGYDHELSSPLRFGGQMALGVAPVELPLFSTLSGSYTVGRVPSSALSPALALSWAEIALGAGGYWPLPSDLQLRVSIQGVVVKLEAHGSDPTYGQQESQRWLMGGQAAFELVGWATRRWGLALGPRVQQLTGATAIAVHGRPVAQISALSFSLGASLELRPFQR